MNKIEEIVRRINRIIDIEVGITKRERDEFEEKKHGEESYWGLGGNTRRYEKCVEAREEHLEQLEALRKQSTHGIQETEELRLYPFWCPSCQTMIYLSDSKSRHTGEGSDIVDCPVCMRTLFRSGQYTTWNVIKGSKYTQLHRGR